MTTQHQIITICVLVFIGVPLGTFTIIKTINKLSTPPVNTLVRPRDIELIDYIEPGYSYPDLLQSPPRIYDRVGSYWNGWTSNPPSYQTGTPPIYQSESLPYYQSVDGININSCLENENNILLFLFFLFMFFLIILTIKISLNSLYVISILTPFSYFDFRDSFEWKFNSYGVKPQISYLKIQTLTEEIIKLLNSLKDDENYSMGLSFISSYKEWQENKDRINPLFINDAIIVNKESDPILITQFIMESLDEKGYFITDWLFKDSSINSMDPIILVVTVAINVKI